MTLNIALAVVISGTMLASRPALAQAQSVLTYHRDERNVLDAGR